MLYNIYNDDRDPGARKLEKLKLIIAGTTCKHKLKYVIDSKMYEIMVH
jgi:hypothetical protein